MPSVSCPDDLKIQLPAIIKIRRGHSPAVTINIHLAISDGLPETLVGRELLGPFAECLTALRTIDSMQADFDLLITRSQHGDAVPIGNTHDFGGYQIIGEGNGYD